MFRALLRTMRPRQWAKNVFVFAGVVFDGRLFDPVPLGRTIAAFVIFCLLSSAVYLINDVVDADKDRRHPTKRNRPIASGELSPKVAVAAAVILTVGSLAGAFAINTPLGLVSLAYLALMMAYSFYLKRLVIIDVMVIAAGFVLRVMAGAAAVQVTRFSPWLYMCSTLLALFIAINKRRNELLLLAEDANNHRASLGDYNLEFLDTMTSLVTATLLASYSFYTFSAPNLPANHSMMLTIPFVLYGVFRYLFLVHARGLGGAPEEIVLSDKPLILTLVLWGVTVCLVLYA
ncbi:MAG: decaprenyl-phosphate phosphoribosyltransferase [Anaerolineales bacterium]